jgi:hypothetical protein
VPGAGGGVVDEPGDGQEIVVTGRRLNSTRNVVNGAVAAGGNSATLIPETTEIRPLDQSRKALTLDELGQWWAGYRESVAADSRVHANDPGVMAGFQDNLNELLAAIGVDPIPITEFFQMPDHIQLGDFYLGTEGIEFEGIFSARAGHYSLNGIFDYNSHNGEFDLLGGGYHQLNGDYSVAWGAVDLSRNGDYSIAGGLVEGGHNRYSILYGALSGDSGSTSIFGFEVAGPDPIPYANPTQRPAYGPGQVEAVWANAQDANGVVHDPNTGEVLTWDRSRSRAGQWDMGHLPRQEYRVLHARYTSGQISLPQFLSEYRNPANYRPESVSANRGHRYEGH